MNPTEAKALILSGKAPDGLRVEGDLDLSNETELRSLPKHLAVIGRLELSGCTALKEIPAGFRCYQFAMDGCTAVEAIPEGTIGYDLSARDCTALVSLPVGLACKGLYLKGCTRLTELPAGLRISGDLYATQCTALRRVGAGTKIAGTLSLEGCTALRTVPADLQVGGYLKLTGCTALESIPDEIEVGGSVLVEGCSALRQIPASMRAAIEKMRAEEVELAAITTALESDLIAGVRALRRFEEAGFTPELHAKAFAASTRANALVKETRAELVCEARESGARAAVIRDVLGWAGEFDALIEIGDGPAIEQVLAAAREEFVKKYHECSPAPLFALGWLMPTSAHRAAAKEVLALALQADNAVAVNAAAIALGRLGDPAGREPLRALLAKFLAGETDYEVDQACGNVALALVALGDPELKELLDRHYAAEPPDMSQGHHVRVRYAWWLLTGNAEEPLALLQNGKTALSLAVSALADLDHKPAIPLLEEVARRKLRPASKLALLEALRRLNRQKASPAPSDWMIWLLGLRHPTELALGQETDNVFDRQTASGFGVEQFETDDSLLDESG